MLDFIYYPVSGILWIWHKVFGAIPFLGPDSGITWALSVIFLVFTVRAVLVIPTVRQIRTNLRMQEMRPRLTALRKKHSNDRQRLALEMRKLQKEYGVKPLTSFLPIVMQAPVFIGLFHVLKSFNRTGDGFGGLGMSIEQNAQVPNYLFSAADVQSFLDARLFGAPISAAMTTPQAQLAAYGLPIPSVWIIAGVALPLMLVAAIATHFNSRASIARQDAAVADNPQAAMINTLMLWVLPFGVVVGGPFLMIAILLYWVANNIWTYAQQHLVFRRIERMESERVSPVVAAAAPRPGARPVHDLAAQPGSHRNTETGEPQSPGAGGAGSNRPKKKRRRHR
ncbi:membrane protein insertase YidC [Millisia brevis]|uniref:membrane protein insertase YidC n=1 Tax=Millisia brevis TaxID=264148 RepID=UPI00082E16F4|nr:membrane protein insertase YidC [Millisia brevis]